MAEPITGYLITPHAAAEMKRRGIDETVVQQVLAAPEQRRRVRAGRDVVQATIDFSGRMYLVRIFVDVDRNPAEVVTVYRTSKIEKYYRNEP